MIVGILALQGDFAEHVAVLRALGVESREVRCAADLALCERLIIPGGESTVIGRLLDSSGLRSAILERAGMGTLPIFGTCAGAILLASDIPGRSAPEPLRLIDMMVDRNAYGAQLQSFETDLTVVGIGTVPVVFIRAPRITRVGAGVAVLAEHGGSPVLVAQGCILASTCHPEIRGETRVHRMFLSM